MKVYKIRDPKTGEFYTGKMYVLKMTSKLGRVWLSLSAIKACLTRFGYDPVVCNLINDSDMEIVEYDLVETSIKSISELKR